MTCPYCAKEIRDTAILCPHCDRDLRGEVNVAPRSDASFWSVGRILMALGIIGVVLAPALTGSPSWSVRRIAIALGVIGLSWWMSSRSRG